LDTWYGANAFAGIMTLLNIMRWIYQYDIERN
jgi:hypothetical protein